MSLLRMMLMIAGMLCGSLAIAAPTAVAPSPYDEFWMTNGVAPVPKAVKILLVGDGLMSGYGLPNEQQSIANRLIETAGKGNMLHPRTMKSLVVENETSASVLSRIKYITALRPHLVVLAVGMNDAAANTDPDLIHNNLASVLVELQRAGIYTLLVGMQAHPSMGGYAYMSNFNSVYPRLAEQFKVPFAPNIMEQVANHTMLLQRDEIYPNAEGAQAIATLLEKQYLESMIKSLSDNLTKQLKAQTVKEWKAQREEIARKKLQKVKLQ